MSKPAVRASDADRERTVVLLRDHSSQGRLTLEEFSERMERAYAATTLDELESLTQDLPAATTAVERRRPARRFTVVVFGDVERTGRWRLCRHLVWITFGNADIDLRQAEVVGKASITAFILFGNVDVYVPEEVAVDLTGVTIFGHRRDNGVESAHAAAPLVRVRVFALFGTADLWRVPRRLAHAGWREVIKTLRRERRAGELPRG